MEPSACRAEGRESDLARSVRILEQLAAVASAVGRKYTFWLTLCFPLREKLPHLKTLIAYAYSHSFATDALINDMGIPQVAELLGHTSTEMVMRHYSHIAGRINHMREAAMKAANAG